MPERLSLHGIPGGQIVAFGKAAQDQIAADRLINVHPATSRHIRRSGGLPPTG